LRSCTIGGFSRRAQLHKWVSEWRSMILYSPNIMHTSTVKT
jgi:hypothetical protein